MGGAFWASPATLELQGQMALSPDHALGLTLPLVPLGPVGSDPAAAATSSDGSLPLDIARRASVPNLGSSASSLPAGSFHDSIIPEQHVQQPPAYSAESSRTSRRRSHSDSVHNSGDDTHVQLKRLRNTEAARRSRMRRAVRTSELETRIEDLSAENHRLILRVANLEKERVANESKKFADAQTIRKLEGQLAEAKRYVLAARRMQIQMQRCLTIQPFGNDASSLYDSFPLGGTGMVSGTNSDWLGDVNIGPSLDAIPSAPPLGPFEPPDLVNEYGVGFG